MILFSILLRSLTCTIECVKHSERRTKKSKTVTPGYCIFVILYCHFIQWIFKSFDKQYICPLKLWGKKIKQWEASIPPISTKRTITSNLYWTHFTQNTTREIQALARDIISNIQISVFRKPYCFKNLKGMTKEPIQRDWHERNLENIHKPQKKAENEYNYFRSFHIDDTMLE